jgi:hypothetical protein
MGAAVAQRPSGPQAAGGAAQSPAGVQSQQAAPAGAFFGAVPGGAARSVYDEYNNNIIEYCLRSGVNGIISTGKLIIFVLQLLYCLLLCVLSNNLQVIFYKGIELYLTLFLIHF